MDGKRNKLRWSCKLKEKSVNKTKSQKNYIKLVNWH